MVVGPPLQHLWVWSRSLTGAAEATGMSLVLGEASLWLIPLDKAGRQDFFSAWEKTRELCGGAQVQVT